MSYRLNKTDGSLLVDLVDGQLDTTSSDLTLIGRNYSGFGEVLNENFIQLLENFANASAPINPIRGQLWFDTAENRLKVYNGSAFTSSGGTTVAENQPNMVAGDLWIDSTKSQLYFFDGVRLQLVGPEYSTAQGTSGHQVASVLDTQNITQTVVKMFIGGNLVGVHSNATFTPVSTARIQELVTTANPTGSLVKGFNAIGTDYKYAGTSTIAESLIDGNGVVRTADQYLVADSDDLTTGALTIQNNAGLTIGLNQNTKLQFNNNAFQIANQLSNQDVEITVRTPAEVSAFKIDTSTSSVGIYKAIPTATLDVGGNVNIDGDLTVGGTTTSVDTVNLRVEDKNIELGYQSDSTGGDDVGADGGGVTLLSTDSNKEIKWLNSTDSWTFNKNIDLSNTSTEIKIGGQTKLTNTSLSNILYADELTRVGTLVSLQVDSINMDGNTIANSVSAINITANGGINLTPGGDIAISGNHKITGLKDPTASQDAATKMYTDIEIANEVIVMGFDITGLGTGSALQAAVAGYLNDLYPATAINNGKQAKLHCTSYANATASGIDVDSAKTISYIAVDANGTQNESVVQDIVFAGASGNVALTATRSLMRFQSNGSGWEWQATTAY